MARRTAEQPISRPTDFADGDKATSRSNAVTTARCGSPCGARSMTGAVSSRPRPAAWPIRIQEPDADVDLDMKLGAIVGFNGEALRSLDFKMSRRAGKSAASASPPRSGATPRCSAICADAAPPPGGVSRGTRRRRLFRFTEVYARMTGGQMSIADGPAVGAEPGATRRSQRPRFTIAWQKRSCSARSPPTGSGQNRRNEDHVLRHVAVKFTRMPGRVGLSRRCRARTAARRHHRRGRRLRARRDAHARHAGAAVAAPTICSARAIGGHVYLALYWLQRIARLKDAQTLAHAALTPVAVLLTRKLMWRE